MLRRADGAGLDCELPLFDHAIRRFFHHLLEQHPQVGVFPIIGRRDVSDAVGMRGKLITFLKPNALANRRDCKPQSPVLRFSSSR